MRGARRRVNAARTPQAGGHLYQKFRPRRVRRREASKKDKQPMGVEPFEHKVTGQRSARRARVLLAARLHTPAGTVEARLRDLSRKGALVECGALPAVGTAVTFERGETRVPATVAWLADGRIGLEFEHAIHESELLIHIGKPSPPAAAPQSFSRPGIIRGMSPKDRRIAKAWSVTVGLSLPDSQG